MATIASGSIASPASHHEAPTNPLAGIRAFFQQFLAKALDPYRPELHYMRGPGPACRAKQAVVLRTN